MNFTELFNELLERSMFTEAELILVCNMYGSTIETLDLATEARYGETLDQMDED